MASPQPSPAGVATGSAAPEHLSLDAEMIEGAPGAGPAAAAQDEEGREASLSPEPENENDEDEDEEEDDEEEQHGGAGDHSDEEELGAHDDQEDGAAVPPKPKRKRKPRPPPRPSAPGTTSLPLARVARILKADESLETVSREATFLISAAAELFLKTVAERAYAVGRLEKRRYISYSDVQSVVSEDIHWSYLRDVVPDHISYGDALAHREHLARHKANAAADFFGVPPAPGLERNPYAEGREDLHPSAYPEDGAPPGSESDVEMKEG